MVLNEAGIVAVLGRARRPGSAALAMYWALNSIVPVIIGYQRSVRPRRRRYLSASARSRSSRRLVARAYPSVPGEPGRGASSALRYE